jgi:hypothetical protein
MSGKNKVGRETRKPKADKNKKVKGQTPAAVDPAIKAISRSGGSASR